MEDLGMDGVLVMSPKQPADRTERAKAHLSRGLRMEDLHWFGGAENITELGPVGETRAVVTGGRVTRRINVYGVTPSFGIIKGRKVSAGRFISDRDEEGVAPVCVLGYKLKQQIFGGGDAIGQQINLGGRRLMVIGVGTEFNMMFVNDDDLRKETGGVYLPSAEVSRVFARFQVAMPGERGGAKLVGEK